MQQKKPPTLSAPFLKKLLKLRIQSQFESIVGARCIYADPTIIQTLNFIYDFKFQSEGPAQKIYELEIDRQAADISSAGNIVFFVYGNPMVIDSIASMIIKNQLVNNKKNYYLYFIPTINYLCMQKLEQAQIKNKLRIKTFNFDLIPFNEDLFSLEVNRTMDPLQEDACILESLLRISKIVGKIKNCFAIGGRSVKLFDRLEETLQQIPGMEDAHQEAFMVVVDRSLDYITPMLTPFSYQGLLDLFFGIKFNKIQIPGSILDSKKPLQPFLLYNPKDRFYKKLAPMYIRQVPQYLRQQSQTLQSLIKQKKQKCTTFEDINQLNQQLIPDMHILIVHKSIAAFLLRQINENQFFNTATTEAEILQTGERVEDLEYLSVFYPVQQVLKLEVLGSQVSGFGSYFSRYEKKIYQWMLNSYHPKHIYTVKTLADRNILRSSKTPLKWKPLLQRLDLIPDTPRSYTYIHTIYSAMLIRFIEMFLTDNLNTETMNLLSDQHRMKGNFKKIRAGDHVYVYFVGGVSYPEVECLRVLGGKLGVGFVVCGSQVTGGGKIIRGCF